MTHVLVVDDDAFVRSGLHMYLKSLGYQVHEAGDVQTAWEMVVLSPPEVAIIDIRLPQQRQNSPSSPPTEPHGLGLTLRLKAAYPTMGIVLLSAHQQYEKDVLRMTQRFMRSIAFLHKGGDMSRLDLALQEVLAGRTLFQAEVVNKYVLTTAVRNLFTTVETPWVEQAAAEFVRLAPREQEVAHLLSASYTPEAIAAHLGLSKGSVDNVISRIYNRLGLADMKAETVDLRPLPILIKACLLYDIQQSP